MRAIGYILHFLCIALAGCSQVSPPVSQLAPPRPWVMIPPGTLPDVKPGDDLYAANQVCRADRSTISLRLKGAQTYIKQINRE